MSTAPIISQSADSHSRYADTFHAEYTNPPFDTRRYSTNPSYAGLQQGLLIRNDFGSSSNPLGNSTGVQSAAQAPGVKKSVKLRFLYNPSDYTMNITPSDTLFPNINGQGNTDPNDTASLIGQTTTTCSISLLFDRTYEANSGLNAPGDPTQFSHLTGVEVDLYTYKLLLGIPTDGNGMALFVPVHLYLGSVHAPSFYGVITSSNLVYTHFSIDMVPLRAVIALSMTQWLDGTNPSTSTPSNPGTTGSAGIWGGSYSAPSGSTTPRAGTTAGTGKPKSITVSRAQWNQQNPGGTDAQFTTYLYGLQLGDPSTIYVAGP